LISSRAHTLDEQSAERSDLDLRVHRAEFAGYADQTVDRLTRRTEQIEVFPESGRAVPEYERDDIRELIEQPYRVIYQIGEEYIDVLSVLHSRQQLPPLSKL